jgi:hypothetical protein
MSGRKRGANQSPTAQAKVAVANSSSSAVPNEAKHPDKRGFVSPKKAKKEETGFGPSLRMYVHQVSIPLTQRDFGRSTSGERVLYRVSVPHENRSTFLSVAKGSTIIARNALRVGKWFDVSGVAPQDYGSTIVYCCVLDKKLEIKLSDQQQDSPGIFWQYAGQGEFTFARDDSYVCLLAGVVQQERINPQGQEYIKVTFGVAGQDTKTVSCLVAAGTVPFANGAVYIITNAKKGSYGDHPTIKINAGTGFFPFDAKWDEEAKNFNSTFDPARYLDEILRIDDVRTLKSDVQRMDQSNGYIEVTCFLSDCDGPWIRKVCAGCGVYWDVGCTGAKGGSLNHNESRWAYRVGVELAHEAGDDVASSCTVYMYDDTAIPLFGITAQEYSVLGPEDHTALFNSHFDKRYNMKIEVKSAKARYPTFNMRRITVVN